MGMQGVCDTLNLCRVAPATYISSALSIIMIMIMMIIIVIIIVSINSNY